MNQWTEFILQKYLKIPRSLLKILLSVSLFNGKYSFDKITDFPNPDFYLQYNKPNHLNLFKNILFFFNQIDYLKFKLIEHSFPFCKNIKFVFELSEEYEIITNPILYQNGVESLSFSSYKNTINLSDKVISNINEIKPKSVYLYHRFIFEGKLNFIDILSGLTNIMKITFKQPEGNNPSSLWFSNTVLKIFQNDRDDFTVVKCKSFTIEIDINYFEDIKEEYRWTDQYSDWFTLRLDKYSQVEFEDFNLISNKEQAAEAVHCFPPWIPDSVSECTVLILAKDLIDAKLNSCIFSLKTNFEAVQWLFSRWSKLKSSIFKMYLPNESRYITDISNLPPQNIDLVVFIGPDILQ